MVTYFLVILSAVFSALTSSMFWVYIEEKEDGEQIENFLSVKTHYVFPSEGTCPEE